jgi:hypothetical protein
MRLLCNSYQQIREEREGRGEERREEGGRRMREKG